MLYVTYDRDGSINGQLGMITQANKFFGSPQELASYEEVARDQLKQQFIKENSPGLVPPEFWYVRNDALTERPVLTSIGVTKTIIKPSNGDDYALITGIPADSKYKVYGANELIAFGVMDSTEMQVSIPVPMVYVIYLDKWPYQTFKLEIRAQL
ncbi:hypothetical protein [Bradyrhizobium sp. Ai1a-2]|uniref:hypothetical protein n=1 Tax=Bradyrhizobium sp. Ai1a-2 TaxID=196490 RepID=UPI0003FD9F9B|nr:hypothetical protein [Bradyrhizobium sp. Ai1a-2]